MKENRRIDLCGSDVLNLEKTFECGQCFRWESAEDGGYCGIAKGVPAKVTEENGRIMVLSQADRTFWEDYFDLGTDYAAAARSFDAGEYLARCADYGRGIRILRQEPWEALCSFIISQCNNIVRIRGIVGRLCERFGEPVGFEGRTFYTFPSAETLAALSPGDLAFLRAGYRAPYIISAARSVSSGETDLAALTVCDAETAKKALLKMDGVGEKVANCVILFGLGHLEAFPVDTWIRKALKEHFPADFDPKTLGSCAGLAQQYIFYYARSTGNSD